MERISLSPAVLRAAAENCSQEIIRRTVDQEKQNGAYGIRTRDLHTASVARSQLRQCPVQIV